MTYFWRRFFASQAAWAFSAAGGSGVSLGGGGEREGEGGRKVAANAAASRSARRPRLLARPPAGPSSKWRKRAAGQVARARARRAARISASGRGASASASARRPASSAGVAGARGAASF